MPRLMVDLRQFGYFECFQSREELAKQVRELSRANARLQAAIACVAETNREAAAGTPAARASCAGAGDSKAEDDTPSLPVLRAAAAAAGTVVLGSSEAGLLQAASSVAAESSAAVMRAECGRLRAQVEAREALLGRQATEIAELERRVEELAS